MIKSNITQVIKNIDKRMNNLESNVEDIEEYAVEYIVGEAKKLAPVRTGTLRRGITKRTSNNESYVIATASYSAYVEYGTVKTRPIELL